MRRGLAIGYVAVVAMALIAIGARPVAFQKVAVIERGVGDSAPGAVAVGASLDVDSVIGGIPYALEERMVWDVEPRSKYRRTILEGAGNCSNLVFGLAYHLEASSVDYQIVHIMHPETFLDGDGHTVIRTHFRHAGIEQIGLVDVREAALPRSGGRFLDVADLRAGPVSEFAMEKVVERPDRSSFYYASYLADAAIGVIPASEVRRYFRFVETLYVPFGSRRLEKYVYDGLAVMLGFYPTIYVEDLPRLAGRNRAEWVLFTGSLWLLRSAVIVLPLLGWAVLRKRRRARYST